MNKRFLLGAGILLALGSLGALLMHWYFDPDRRSPTLITSQDIADAKRRLRESVPSDQQPAVLRPLDFSKSVRLAIGSLGMADEEQDRNVADLVLANLSGAAGLDLVDRQSLNTGLQEMSLSLSGLVRAQDAVRLGKLVRADWFVLGTGTEINGTNTTVLRIVDARTGILRDAEAFSAGKATLALAEDIAGFVRRSRENAATATSPAYLAIGAFEDLSLNNKLSQFATRLRASLMAAYQSTGIKLLEREAVDTLLEEVTLDLAGLTEEGAGGARPQPMQSAYWLVQGQFQSLENSQADVELVLRVRRLWGRATKLHIQGQPSDSFYADVKNKIDRVMNRNTNTLIVARPTEAHLQMAIGRELSGLDESILSWASGYGGVGEQDAMRQRRNAEEAIRAFKTALLLDPGNRESRMYLAASLRSTRIDEARNYWREVLEEDVKDKWTTYAQRALLHSFESSDPVEKTRWFTAALRQGTNTALAAFYREHAGQAAEEVIIQSGTGSRATELAEKKLFEAIRSAKSVMDGNSGTVYGSYGMYNFLEALGGDTNVTARRLAELYPAMVREFPELAPHLAAEALRFQVNTNTTLLAEFEKRLDECVKHPEKLFKPDKFWSSARDAANSWLTEHHQYDLATRALEGYHRTKAKVSDEERVALAYAYADAGRWQQALDIFESFGGRPVRMSSNGKWGKAWRPVLPTRLAAVCRKKLGLSVVSDPREFDMGTNVLCLHGSSTFAAEQDALWIAVGNQLLHLDTDLNTNLVMELPMSPSTPINALCVSPASVWIATGRSALIEAGRGLFGEGEGLIEFDRNLKQCRRWTTEDGLAMNSIASLQLDGESLWIGYGVRDTPGGAAGGKGGIGQFDLTARRFKYFTLSLAEGTEFQGNPVRESLNKPTRRSVKEMAMDPSGEIWFVTDHHPLRSFKSRKDVWTGFAQLQHASALATDAAHLYVGEHAGLSGETRSGPLGLQILNIRDGRWRSFPEVGGINSRTVSAVTPDGDDLWVGGVGYVALLDLKENRTRKLAYVRTRFVEQIQIAGGYVWAIFEEHLHRAPLSDLQ